MGRKEDLIYKRGLLMKQTELLKEQARLTNIGEDDSWKEEYGHLKKKQAESEINIAKRGNINPKEILKKFKNGQKLEGTFESVAAPFQMLEAAVANPLITAQTSNDYAKIPMDIIDGLRGKKLGEMGDLFFNAGMPRTHANITGLAYDMAIGGAILETGVKGLTKGFRYLGDKKILKGIDEISSGAKRAGEAGKQIGNEFWKGIDDIKVGGDKVLDFASQLPKTVISFIEESADDVIENIIAKGDLKTMRQLKQTLGQLKSSAFDTAMTSVEKLKVNKLYAKASDIISDTLKINGQAKNAKNLEIVNNASEQLINAEKIIQKNLMTKAKEAKTMNAIKKTTSLGGESFRESIRELGKTGKKLKKAVKVPKPEQKEINAARKMMHNGINKMKDAAFVQAIGQLSNMAIKSGIMGGIAGSIGAKAARKSLEGFDMGGGQ